MHAKKHVCKRKPKKKAPGIGGGGEELTVKNFFDALNKVILTEKKPEKKSPGEGKSETSE